MQISSFIFDSYSINLCLGYQLCLICLLIPLYFSIHLHRHPGIFLPNLWTLPSESCLPFCLEQEYSYLCGQGGDVTRISIFFSFACTDLKFCKQPPDHCHIINHGLDLNYKVRNCACADLSFLVLHISNWNFWHSFLFVQATISQAWVYSFRTKICGNCTSTLSSLRSRRWYHRAQRDSNFLSVCCLSVWRLPSVCLFVCMSVCLSSNSSKPMGPIITKIHIWVL